ncbi:MarR family winged helix-turn-helix transcriptional regulator [Yoonia sp. SS1-5]|uniref:MarR family winged helix-turn-helix transcriptional regulator n=1 Tax=Yoonia rhodophyticola TaxID=3137370 RepID=A0AAN0MKH2_9RHOB
MNQAAKEFVVEGLLDTDYRLHLSAGYRLSRISRLIQTRLESQLAEIGLTRMKWCVLASIGLSKISTSSELADYIGVTRQATSRVLVQMRKEGLIDQVLDALDGRSRLLKLTPKGIDLLNQCVPMVEKNRARFLDKLSKSQRKEFDRFIDIILEGESTPVDSL